MNETKKAAHIAGAIYLSMVFTGPISLIYAPSKLVVRGNPAATADNFLAHPTLVNVWIAADLTGAVIFICLGLALFRLLGRVNRNWALLMMCFIFVSVAIGFVTTLNMIAARTLFGGADIIAALAKPQRDALGMLFLRLNSNGNFVNEIFWGLWLFPFGLLVARSGFLPRILGIWLIVNCFAWIILSPIALFAPAQYPAAFQLAQPVLYGELAITLWLLIMGAKTPPEPVATLPVTA
jgi:hypothetical protein